MWLSGGGNTWKGGSKDSPKDTNKAALHNFTYTIIYIVLVFYTVSFFFIYVKRVLYMALLTILAPLVAMYYPIDKITDGQAQGFNTWLKEYVFNLLMQPFHLIIYTMLVGSAMKLAVNNPIYAIVAIGFIMPAERLIRELFQLKKASTTGDSGSMIGTMMGLHMIQPFKGILGKGGKSPSDGGESGGGTDPKLRTTDNTQGGTLPAGSSGNGGTGGGSKAPSGKAIQNTKTGTMLRVAGKTAAKGLKSVGKTAGRVAVAGVGAATGAVIGAAAGIAQGKPAEALKYGAVFGGTGAKLGGTAINGVKKFGDGAEKAFKGGKEEYLQRRYGTNDADEIRFIKENETKFKERYDDDPDGWWQEALALRREGLINTNDIHNAIALQRDGISYEENQIKEKTIKSTDDQGRVIEEKEYELVNKGRATNVKIDRETAVKAVKQVNVAKNLDLNNEEKVTKLHRRMAQAYENQGLDGDEEASRYIGVLRSLQDKNRRAGGNNL